MSHRVRLGRSELRVSPICFGTWQLSPRFWGKQSEEDIMTAMRRAFELGVNFYDTADAYGEGYAETITGKGIAGLPREQIVVATKVFHHFYPDGHRHGDLSGPYVVQACENSLKRMKLDYLDLYQCHAFDPLVDPLETVEALRTLVRQGKIRAYGTSNWSVEQLRLGLGLGNFATCQPLYSLIDRGIENDLLPLCQAHDVGVLAYSPLHNGLLTGKYAGTETFSDFRKEKPEFNGEKFKTLCQQVHKLESIAQRYQMNTVQLVLTVTLMHPGITCAIVGIKHSRHIEEAAAAMGKNISREDWYQVRTLLKG